MVRSWKYQEYFLVYFMSSVKKVEHILPELRFSTLTSHTHPLFLSFSGSYYLDKSRGLGVLRNQHSWGERKASPFSRWFIPCISEPRDGVGKEEGIFLIFSQQLLFQ